MDEQTSRTKKKSNRKRSSKKKTSNGALSDENDVNSDDDLESVASSVDLPLNEALEDGVEYNENFEQKFLDSIEGAREKSAKTRYISLVELKNGLCKRYLYDFLMSRKDSLLDLIEKLLKKGQPEDCVMSSDISSALCIQLGVAEATRIFTTLKPLLINMLNDESASPSVRASAASALGITCFIGSEEPEDTVACLNALKTSFMKKIPADTSHHVPIANSLLSWSLLLTVAPSSVVEENISSALNSLELGCGKIIEIKHHLKERSDFQMFCCIAVMCKILELGDLNLRIATGETLALVYELAREANVKFQGPVSTLYSLLRDLANESGRHKGKREKKQQKASFRDFLKSVERGHSPNETIKFGQEYLEMSSWICVRRYNAFKDALGCGINIHLKSNTLLRDIFGLGLPISNQIKLTKNEKYERQLINEACSKDRTLARSLKRDNKRSGLT